MVVDPSRLTLVSISNSFPHKAKIIGFTSNQNFRLLYLLIPGSPNPTSYNICILHLFGYNFRKVKRLTTVCNRTRTVSDFWTFFHSEVLVNT